MYVIAIDIGTTNSKIVLFKLPFFQVIDTYIFESRKIKQDTHTDFDINFIWDEIKAGIKRVSRDLAEKREIAGISISSVGESGVLLTNDNEVVGPAIAWFDTRGKEHIEKLQKENLGLDFYQIAGIPLHSNYSIAKIMWLREYYPEAKQKDIKWVCLANYIAFKLTGRKTMEASLASRTLVYDISKKEWSEPLLRLFQLDTTLFPEVLHSGESVGTLKEDLALELDFDESVLVSVAGHDHMAGSVAARLDTGREILNSTGTTEGLLYLQKAPILTEESYNSNVSNGIYVNPELYSYFASLPSAGYAIEWYRKIFSMQDRELFEGEIESLYGQYVDGQLGDKEIFFIPHLRGSGPPARSNLSKGAIYGITEQTTKADFTYSLFLGLCFELKQLFTLFQTLARIGSPVIKVIGPAVRNPLWLQLKADVLDCEIHAYEIHEAVAKGAAMNMAIHQKWIHQNELNSVPVDVTVYKPDPERTRLLAEIFTNKYLRLVNAKQEME
jgi:sugar (pentulose or hexulose) kinase